jgi:hypothetical protein
MKEISRREFMSGIAGLASGFDRFSKTELETNLTQEEQKLIVGFPFISRHELIKQESINVGQGPLALSLYLGFKNRLDLSLERVEGVMGRAICHGAINNEAANIEEVGDLAGSYQLRLKEVWRKTPQGLKEAILDSKNPLLIQDKDGNYLIGLGVDLEHGLLFYQDIARAKPNESGLISQLDLDRVMSVDGFFTPIKKNGLPVYLTPKVFHWQNEIVEESQKASIDPAITAAVISIESQGDPQAISKAGAKGLMQLMPSNCQGIDAFKPQENIGRGLEVLNENMRYLLGKGIRVDDLLLRAVHMYHTGSSEPYNSDDSYMENFSRLVSLIQEQADMFYLQRSGRSEIKW